MVYRHFHNEMVSIVGFGTWGLGIQGFLDVNEIQARKTFEKALELGINLVDTSPFYGNGRAEKVVGEVLKEWGGAVFLCSKFGLVWEYGAQKKINIDHMERELEETLVRTQRNKIDLYQIHYPQEEMDFEKIYSFLERKKREGIIRFLGVCNVNSVGFLKKIEAGWAGGVDSVQNSFHYLDAHTQQEILEYTWKKKIAYLAYSPLAQGLLCGKKIELRRKDRRVFSPLFQGEALEKALREVKSLQESQSDLVDFALSFVLKTPGVVSALMGVTKLHHLLKNLRTVEKFQGEKNE